MERQGRIARAAGVMSAATLVSRVLGFVKDMILARLFGATGVSDTFFVAFRIPNLLRELFAEGSMSSAFVPVLTQVRAAEGEAAAARLVRATFTFLLLVVGAVCLAGMLFAPQIVALIAPGFLADPAKLAQTVLLTRVMFPFLLFVSLAALVMGALNTRGVFFVPALAPAVLNVVTIAAVLALVGVVRPPIAAVAVGVALGGFAQFAWQLPAFHRAGLPARALARLSQPRAPAHGDAPAAGDARDGGGAGEHLRQQHPRLLPRAGEHHVPLLRDAADPVPDRHLRRRDGHGGAAGALGARGARRDRGGCARTSRTRCACSSSSRCRRWPG